MIYLVRHGETDFNKFSVSQGQLQTSLNAKGIEQAKELAEKLKDYKFDMVISSRLIRAIQTAEHVLKYHPENELLLDERIMEASRGSLEGKKNPQEVYDEFFKDPHKFGGETNEDVINRLTSFLKDLEKHIGKRILIVTHGGVFMGFNFIFQGKDLQNDKYERYETKNCAVKEYEF